MWIIGGNEGELWSALQLHRSSIFRDRYIILNAFFWHASWYPSIFHMKLLTSFRLFLNFMIILKNPNIIEN